MKMHVVLGAIVLVVGSGDLSSAGEKERPAPPAQRLAPAVPTESYTTLYRPLTPLTAGWESYRDHEALRQWQFGRQRDLIDWMQWRSQYDGSYFSYGPQYHWQDVFEPWGTLGTMPGDIHGYRVPQIVRQPAGHRITFYGPNAYTYEPVYDDDAADANAQTPFFKQPPARAVPNGAAVQEKAPVATARNALADARAAFRAGRYEDVLALPADFRPAQAAAAPQVLLLRIQALFALERYDEAAETLRRCLKILPVEDCGDVVRKFNDYYAQGAEFTRQLRALEDHVDDQPDSASARLLLGFQYGFLGHAREAVEQLEQAVRLSPADRDAAALLEFFKQPARPAQPREDLRRF